MENRWASGAERLADARASDARCGCVDAASAPGPPAVLALAAGCHPAVLADRGTRNPIDLLISERVAIILGHAIDGARIGPALEQTKLPCPQPADMELSESTL